MIVIDHKTYPTAWSERNGKRQGVFDDVYYYAIGVDPPHYPVPALADTNMVLCLAHVTKPQLLSDLAWDGIWRDGPLAPHYD